jgi:hypothetical protein
MPIYSQITGSITAGLLLSQIVYWWYNNKGEEFYKTNIEFCRELSMGLDEFKGAKNKLAKIGIIKITRKGIPAKSFYTLDEDKLIKAITSKRKNHQQVGGKSTNWMGENPPTITENTTETTTDILLPEATEDIFDFKSKLKEMFLAKDRRMPIIAYYWTVKGIGFENAKTYSAGIKRELRPATLLTGYSNEQIKKTANWLKENANFRWTIETIHKYIDEPLDNLRGCKVITKEQAFDEYIKKQKI